MDLGGLSDLNLSELQQYLGRMNFPADKHEVPQAPRVTALRKP